MTTRAGVRDRRLLYDLIALLVMSFIMSLSVISSPHLTPNLCH